MRAAEALPFGVRPLFYWKAGWGDVCFYISVGSEYQKTQVKSPKT